MRRGVLQFELMQGLAMLPGEIGYLTFPFLDLPKCHYIAVECRKASSIIENRVRQQFGVTAAGRCENRSVGPAQLVKKRSRLPVFSDILLEASEAQNLLGVIQTSMHDVAHEGHHNMEILPVHVVLILHSLAHQPQNLQTTEDYLMLFRA